MLHHALGLGLAQVLVGRGEAARRQHHRGALCKHQHTRSSGSSTARVAQGARSYHGRVPHVVSLWQERLCCSPLSPTPQHTELLQDTLDWEGGQETSIFPPKPEHFPAQFPPKLRLHMNSPSCFQTQKSQHQPTCSDLCVSFGT